MMMVLQEGKNGRKSNYRVHLGEFITESGVCRYVLYLS